MKNKMKMLAIAAVLVSSVAQVDAHLGDAVKKVGNKITRNTWDWQLVNRSNDVFPHAEYFPGTWPLNRVEVNTDDGECYLRPTVSSRSFRNFKLGLGKQTAKMLADGGMPNTTGNHPINPSIQLGFTVLCKWLPAALIVRGIYKAATKKKKKHKKHDKKGYRDMVTS